jgi:hypothetical protein
MWALWKEIVLNKSNRSGFESWGCYLPLENCGLSFSYLFHKGVIVVKISDENRANRLVFRTDIHKMVARTVSSVPVLSEV